VYSENLFICREIISEKIQDAVIENCKLKLNMKYFFFKCDSIIVSQYFCKKKSWRAATFFFGEKTVFTVRLPSRMHSLPACMCVLMINPDLLIIDESSECNELDTLKKQFL
jgi:hypothetical protein